MSFEATKTFVILGAITTQYLIEHPQFNDANTGNPTVQFMRNTHLEIANATSGTIYVAFDRLVVAPSGNGVQGKFNLLDFSRTGPVAGTQGDFDVAILAASGWPALDCVIPNGSRFMNVYVTAAGSVAVSYGLNDNG